MYGERLNSIKIALKLFVENIINNKNIITEIILFNDKTESFSLPNNKDDAIELIDKKVYASGGTDFHNASIELVISAKNILKNYKDFQVNYINNLFKKILYKFLIKIIYKYNRLH